LAGLDVADGAVDEAHARPAAGAAVLAVAGPVRAAVLVGFHEGVHRVTVGGDARPGDHAVLVLGARRFVHGPGAAPGGGLEGGGGVVDALRVGALSVAVVAHVLGGLGQGRMV